jgi:hypothetical protein
MKVNISANTLNILKNFSSINKSIVIKPGNVISTLSINKNILARAEVTETFPTELSIYDLGLFLGGLTLFKDPYFDCSDDKKVTVTDSTGAKSVFYYADPSVIVTPPDKEIELPSIDVQFSLESDVLSQLQKAAAIYSVPDLCLYGHDGKIYLSVNDKKNETSNVYSLPVGTTEDEFCYCLKMENLKLLPGSYDVQISNPKVAKFTGKNNNVSYWIALEPDAK